MYAHVVRARAGSLAVLLAWFYYSSMILYLGVEFSRELALAHQLDPQPTRHAMRIPEADTVPVAR